MRMLEVIYDECLAAQESGEKAFYKRIVEKYPNDYSDKEQLRSAFRREKTKRGIKTVYPNVAKLSAKSPAILLLDIETSPLQVFSWGIYDQRLSIDNIIRDWSCICWSCKWLGDSEVLGDVCTSDEAKEGDDERIIISMWEMINQANIVITHNGNNFDLKKLNTRFLLHGLNPPSKYYSVDTYQVARNTFGFSSNKLDYLSTSFGFKGKIDTDYELWKRCYVGEQDALDEMFTYNQNDVVELENVYLKLLPWIKNHPNVSIYSNDNIERCPKCGNEDLNWSGFYYTSTGKFEAFRCNKCGAVGRSKVNELSKDKKATLLTQG
jgi:DNA polymerase elongation subunit (family B)